MTIAAAYLTSEGVVLGADSTTTVTNPAGGQVQVVQLLNHAQKVFQVGERSRIGFCTWGTGKFGTVSHRTLAAQLSEQQGFATFTVAQAAQALMGMVLAARAAANVNDVTGYFLGGWDLVTHQPQCFRLVFQPGQNPVMDQLGIGQVSFQGIPNFFTRAFHGYDPVLPQRLKDAVAAAFWQQPQQLPQNYDALFFQAFHQAVAPLAAVGFEDVPIREAIDFVFSYIHITIKAFKFRFGPPPCGGPIELAFISTDRPFRWALHKSFQTAMYEQEPTREYD
jgi:hypothetical protein